MEELKKYLESIEVEEHKVRMKEIFQWIELKFPQLEGTIKWNQPMYMDHGTFIIGFSRAKYHMSFTPEETVIKLFSEDIIKSGYEHTKGLAKIKWNDKVDYDLLERVITFNVQDKVACKTFFRK